MQKQANFVTKAVRTYLKLSQQQTHSIPPRYNTQQQQQQAQKQLLLTALSSQQIVHLHAAANSATASSNNNAWTSLYNSPKQQQEQPLRQTHIACNSFHIAHVHPNIRAIANTPNTTLQQSTSNTAAGALLFSRRYSKFTAAREPPHVLGVTSHPLTDERAHDLIHNLKDSERAAIKTALEKYDAMKLKEGFEGKLAATQWRTRFGRLSRVPALGDVDPTGSFCEFPADWLKKKAAEKAKEPTSLDLWKIFFVNAVPFVAFGFLDNFTMIIAGDYIEYIFGTFMCISTMAAAGLGNTISDVLGIGSAYYVERGCEIMGLRPPDLTPIQMEMKSSRRSANYGRIIGITVGCLVGMFPLMFMDKKPSAADEAQTTKSK